MADAVSLRLSATIHGARQSEFVMSDSATTGPITQQLYTSLPASMYAHTPPSASAAPKLVALNERLLNQLGVDTHWFRSAQGLATLSGQPTNTGNPPIALAYAGHQFGNYSPLLGDGRAHLLGQLQSGNGQLLDVQLKGSGRTPFSRGGDGRATLGAVIREYLVTEAMAGLGIPTTGALAVVSTGEQVLREQALPGAILVRSATSHVRVGTFQYAYAKEGASGAQELADFVIEHYFPELAAQPDNYLALLNAVVERQARLIAQWMLVGFIHGVMNTDNASIVGETIDYGPCAFMDEFHPQKVFSSIDQMGRYAWDQQASIGYWNMARFAETLLPVLHEDPEEAKTLATACLDKYVVVFQEAFQQGILQKLGLDPATDAAVAEPFIESTWALLANNALDFTQFFDRLTEQAKGNLTTAALAQLANDPAGIAQVEAWQAQWQTLLADDPQTTQRMRAANPALIARNHQVEEAIRAATEDDDLAPFRRLCSALADPYQVSQNNAELQQAPKPEQRVTQTFCGT